MGTISRHSNAPYVDGETLSAEDLEHDISTAYTEINGNLDDNNVKSAAAINGSKIADSTITNAKMTSSTLTTASMNASAVPKAYVSTASGTAACTVSTTFVDVTGITAATLTPGSTNDIIFCDFQYMTEGSSAQTLQFGFSVDGTDTGSLMSSGQGQVCNYAVQATATTAHVIKPRYLSGSGFTGNFNDTYDPNRVFRVMIIPVK
jgi:hypothetical protein